MKRLMAMLLALVMVLSMIPMTAIPAFAEEYLILDEPVAEEPAAPVAEEEPAEEPAEAPAKKNVETPTSGTCGDSITWTFGDGVLTFSGEGQMCELDCEALPWAAYLQDVTSVVVEEGIQTLDCALYGLTNMTSLFLPSSLREMGTMQRCDSLTTLTIPEGVTTIGHSAISRCENLETIYLPSTLTTIENYGISFLPSLKNITFSDGLTQIGNYLFRECNSLTEVTIPDGITAIGNGSFAWCANLQKVTIPGSIKQIGDNAFERCDALAEVIFEGDAPECSGWAFWGVQATVYYPANNPTWTDAVKQDYSFAVEWVPVEELVPGVNCGYVGTHYAGVINGHDCSVADDGSLLICSCNFPDKNFSNYILEVLDTDGSGTLNADELAVTRITCCSMEIASLQGIQYFAELTYLDCSGNALTGLDVSANTALTTLWCNWNALTELNVSANTALEHLDCGWNALTELDVSANTVLKSIGCERNALTELDVSTNTALWDLFCDFNQLTALNVSNNTALIRFDCSDNNLSALDVSANTLLKELSCSNNNLTALNVSANTVLEALICGNNSLGTVNVSNNPNLWHLDCSETGISALDISNNTELTHLWCNENQLTELDISNNTKLTNLGCMGNGIAELDISAHTGLVVLQCQGNPIGTLDVSQHTALEILSCSGCGLAELDVSANTKLTELSCSGNGFTTLDLSANTKLVDLICWNGNLEELILPENAALQHVYCNGNRLTSLDVSNVPKLEWLDVSDNNLTKLDLTNNTKLYDLKCHANALTQLDLPAEAGIDSISCDDQYYEGYLPLAVTAEEGVFVADMTGIVDVSKIANIVGDGWAIDPEANTITFDYNPNETGFTYEYATGFMDHTMTVNVNIPMSGGDEEPEYIVLEIPAIEDMTQLFLNGEAVVQWTAEDHENENYKWFYFIPEENMEVTFVTAADLSYEEHLDPMAYWTDAEGNVLVHSDDHNDANSAIYVDAAAGETYFFAVKSLNGFTGPLPVIVLEGDHMGGGGGEGWGEPDFSQIAPPLEDMTVLEQGVESTATINNPGEYDWFTFTPAVSGTYSFFSARTYETNIDPYGYLLSADLELLDENDDSAGDLNFSMTHFLEAGQTCVLVAKAWGQNTGSFPVKVAAAKEVTGISVEPISLPEGSWCEYSFVYTDEGMEANPYYYWQQLIQATLTFSDGTTASGVGTRVTHEGITYQLSTFDHQIYGIDPWKAGKTYDVTVSYGELEVKTTVKVTANQIKSISFEDISIRENSYGGWSDAYDEEEDEYLGEYFRYEWRECLKWTVTFKDGKKISGTGSNFEDKNGHTYLITTYDDQWYTRPWLAGGTYSGHAYVAGIDKSVDVSIRTTTIALDPVQNLRITDVSESSVKIAFDAVEQADRYEIYWNGAYMGSTTKTSYTISGLSLGNSGWITVAAAMEVDDTWYAGPIEEDIWVRTYKDISDYYAKLEYTSTVYDGTAKRPTVTLKTSSSGKTISPETYGVEYGWNVGVGQAWMEIDGFGQYGGFILKDFKILPQQVTGVEVTETTHNSATITFDPVEGATEYWVYNGSKRVAKIQDTTYTFTDLTAGKTYKFSVKANAVVVEQEPDLEEGVFVPAGTADYTGAASETVSVKPVYSMEECSVTVKYATKAYTGKSVTNTFTVKSPDGKTLKKDTDYKVTYENNKNIGTATATITGKGKYTGSLTATFDIVPAQMGKPKVKLEQMTRGTALYITFKTVKHADWFNIYLNGELYNSTGELGHFTEYLAPGTYNVTVAAVSYIDGKEYVGAPSSAAKVTVRHSVKNCPVIFTDGDMFVYTGKSHKPAVAVYGYNGEVLTEGVDYTLSYKNNKNTGKGYVEVKGKGVYDGSTKAYFTINPAQVTGLKVSSITKNSVKISFKKSSSNSAKYYNIYVDGQEIGRTTGSSYTIKDLEPGTEYSVFVVPEKTVSGITYGGIPSEVIYVRPGTDIGKFKVTLEYTEIAWTGELNEPAVTVKTSSKSSATTLVEGVDYTVTYVAVVGPGEAGVIIEGIGEYAGTISKTFDIVPPQVEYVFAQAVTNTKMEVVWNEVPGATEYWVYVNGSRKAKVSDTVCTISGLKKGKTYKVTVKAVAEVNGEDFVGAASEVEQCYMGVKA